MKGGKITFKLEQGQSIDFIVALNYSETETSYILEFIKQNPMTEVMSISALIN